MTVAAEATITCPECGSATVAAMPTDACLFFFTCPSCSTRLSPKQGDCCVFCSYSDQRCPPKQEGGVPYASTHECGSDAAAFASAGSTLRSTQDELVAASKKAGVAGCADVHAG